MLGGLMGQLRNVQAMALLAFMVLTSAAIGLVWISIAVVDIVSATLGPQRAALWVGLFAFAPFAILVVWRLMKSSARPAEDPAARLAAFGGMGQVDVMGVISRAAQNMTATAPLTALAVAALAGLLLARFPYALGLLAQVLAQQAAEPRRD